MEIFIVFFTCVVAVLAAPANVLDEKLVLVRATAPQTALLAHLKLVPQTVLNTSEDTTTEFSTEPTTEVQTETPTAQFNNKLENGRDDIKLVENEKLTETEEFIEEGVYYVYHPNGLLQKVVFSTRNDVQDMGYTAQLTYRDVEPIKEPIYTYDPETLQFQQLVYQN